MPRTSRISALRLLSYLMAQSNNGQAVFLTLSDYEAFLAALQITRKRYPFLLYASVIMLNHL